MYLHNLLLFFCYSLYLVQVACSTTRPHPCPPPEKLAELRFHRASRPLRKVNHSDNSPPYLLSYKQTAPDTDKKEAHYSTNWAGAVLNAPPPNATYTYVSATIHVPTPTPTPSSTKSDYEAASAWLGIDGATHTTAILQTGIDMYVIDGVGYTDAWYEWYPDSAQYFDEFAVLPGDVLVASVNATSDKQGVCVMENLTSGKSVTTTVSAPKSTATMAGVNAEWIVEDYSSDGKAVSFVGFGEVRFSGCVAGSSQGGKHGVQDSEIYDLALDGVVVARAELIGEDGVVVTREGM